MAIFCKPSKNTVGPIQLQNVDQCWKSKKKEDMFWAKLRWFGAISQHCSTNCPSWPTFSKHLKVYFSGISVHILWHFMHLIDTTAWGVGKWRASQKFRSLKRGL